MLNFHQLARFSPHFGASSSSMSSPGGDPSARLSHPEEIREIQVATIKKNTAINGNQHVFLGGYVISHSIKARKGMKNLHLYLQTIIRNIPKTFTLQRALLPLLPLNLGVIQQLPAASPAFKKIVEPGQHQFCSSSSPTFCGSRDVLVVPKDNV